MTHLVEIRVPTNVQTDQLTKGTWFKQTTKTAGVKTTTLFQRADKPRSFGQKIVDFFSGIKKAKDSVTLTEAFKCINKNTEFAGRFNENLIPQAVKMLQDDPNKVLESGKYRLELNE
jgi:hypothetical protein